MQTIPASALTRLDPAQAWQPWQGEAFTLKWAAHLHRRAGFGAPAFHPERSTWESLQHSVKQGVDQSLDQLLTGSAGQAEFDQLLAAIVGQLKEEPNEDGADLRATWLYRCIYSPHPLRERLTLFWHNHFATSIAKVRNRAFMLRQNETIRTHALGSFRTLVLEISRDPAMLVWLDSSANVKGKPNENLARELMELFTLGVGNYTEQDVREAARAFTGWHVSDGKFAFNKDLHDDGQKTVLGQRGAWQGADIVRIILEQPAAARFLVRKLFREFISETDDPPAALVEPLAEQFRKSNYDIAGLMKTLLRSRLFFSEHAWRRRVKSPIEHAVGLIRTIDERIAVSELAALLQGIGQSLFAPPNVKGWKGGKAWLNSATLLARQNLAGDLVGGTRRGLLDAVKKHGGSTPAEQVAFLLNLFVQGEAGEPARKKLIDFLAAKPAEGEEPEERLRATAHAVLVMPEFQLA